MSIIIKEITTKKELNDFIKFQLSHYKDNRYFIPPLISDELNTFDKKKNPVFDFCETVQFIALKDEKIVGRIAGIIHHRSNEKFAQKHARFGWVEMLDDS